MNNITNIGNVLKNNTNLPPYETEQKQVKAYPVKFKANDNDQFIRNNRQSAPAKTNCPQRLQACSG